MIDNRPKKRRAVKQRADAIPVAEAPKPVEIHTSVPVKETKPTVSTKAVQAAPFAGIGAGLGGLGGLGVIPLVLAVSALQKGRAQPAVQHTKSVAALPALPPAPIKTEAHGHVKDSKGPGKPGGAKPSGAAAKPAAAEVAAAAAAPAHDPQTGRKPRGNLRAYKKPADKAPEQPDPATAAAQPLAQPPIRPAKPSPKPQDIRNLLSDLSGYLPGTGSSSAARISRIMGIAEEIRNMNGESGFVTQQAADPMDRNIGLLNVLSRNLPFTGASHLGRASQVLSLVNTLKGSGGQGSGGIGGISNIAGMLGNMMGQSQSQPQPQPQQMKNVTPAQADGIKDTVNKLLSGMDDKQKNDLLDKAKGLLGKR